MSKTLEYLIAAYVRDSARVCALDEGSRFHLEKRLEQEVVQDIMNEHVDQIEAEAKRREQQRRASSRYGEFRDLLIQGVILALLVGLVGSHVYGLLEAWIYQPDQTFQFGAAAVGCTVTLVALVTILFKLFIDRLIELLETAHATR